jgi:hypothetical protein
MLRKLEVAKAVIGRGILFYLRNEKESSALGDIKFWKRKCARLGVFRPLIRSELNQGIPPFLIEPS